MRLFLLFLAVPLIEIALFIQIGGIIGLFPTLGIVILTAILGAFLIRAQGFAVLNSLRRSLADLQDPTEPLAHGAMVLFAGALLLTPGFFTDALGLSLMVPGVRGRIFRFIRARVVVQSFQYGSASPKDTTIIEGEYEEMEPRNEPSGWTRH